MKSNYAIDWLIFKSKTFKLIDMMTKWVATAKAQLVINWTQQLIRKFNFVSSFFRERNFNRSTVRKIYGFNFTTMAIKQFKHFVPKRHCRFSCFETPSALSEKRHSQQSGISIFLVFMLGEIFSSQGIVVWKYTKPLIMIQKVKRGRNLINSRKKSVGLCRLDALLCCSASYFQLRSSKWN